MGTLTKATAAAVIRPARLDDITALLDVEKRCFDSDRLSRRSFNYMLTKGKCALLVAEETTMPGVLIGYTLVLFHAGTSLARLYSLAVTEAARGRGLGDTLMDAAEKAAVAQGCVSMRLEVRRDNASAIRLYERRGYRQFTVVPDYYEDHMEALRFEKRIAYPTGALQLAVPYYAQTTDFTCGPSCLMMAMKTLDPAWSTDKRQEIQLWREATTIFMTSGLGGCGPLGLALAAHRRGFGVDVWISAEGPLFTGTVRDPAKKEVIELVHADFAEQAEMAGIPVHRELLTVEDITARIAKGHVPIVLISQYWMYRERTPHWVVLTGFDDRFIYFNDPDVDEESHKTDTDCIAIPIARADFDRMARFGKNSLRAAVILSPPQT